MSKASEKNQPMDTSIRERVIPVPATNAQRVCWAAKTLVAEVEALFPETPVEYSNRDGRNTALDVSFDFSPLDQEDYETAQALLDITGSDHRIAEVIVDVKQVLVSFKSDPRTQDSRDPFGLDDTLLVLNEDD